MIEWVYAGVVIICPEGKPRFPQVPACPGLYRITLTNGRIYIGEAQDLRRRLGEYRHPTKGNEGEHVMHLEIKQAGGGSLQIYPTPTLAERRERRALEQAEISAAIARGDTASG